MSSLDDPRGGSAVKPTAIAIIPVHNEVGAITDVIAELTGVLVGLTSRFEILIVDDGSTDGSPNLLRQLAEAQANLSVLELVRRTGKSTAVQAGLDRIPKWADFVVLLDGDGQDDPTDLPKFFEPILAGDSDMVIGWRRSRAENAVRTVPSRVANRMLAGVTGMAIHDFGSPLKVMRADIAEGLHLRGDMHRFIPALGALAGARVSEVPVLQRRRTTGRSKYGLGRTGKVLLDMMGLYFIQRFADRPIRLFGTIGLWLGAAGAGLMIYLGIERIFFGQPMTTRPFFLISIFLLLSAVIVITNGLTAELLSQSLLRHESRARAYTLRRDRIAEINGDRTKT